MKKFLLLIVALSALAASAQMPQNLLSEDDHKFYDFVNLPDSMEVYKALYTNTPLESEFMLVPKFAVVGFNKQFVLSLGASMKFTASFDWGNPVKFTNEMGLSQIEPALNGENKLFQMGASGSGIYLNIIGFPNSANQIGLFASLCLDKDNNNKYIISTGHIYMRYRNITAGYTTSLYSDPVASMYKIDERGACASGAHSAIGINYQHKFDKIWIGAGVEVAKAKASYTQIVPKGTSIADVKARAATYTQKAPDIPAYVAYTFKQGYLRLAGILHPINYVNFRTTKGKTELCWGVQFSGTARVDNFRFLWQGQYGRGIANFFKDNDASGLDLVPLDYAKGTLQATHSYGFALAAQYYFTPKLFTGFEYCFIRNITPNYSKLSEEGKASTTFDTQMRKGYTITANLIWKISQIFNVGLEYRYGRRYNENPSYDSSFYSNLYNNRLYAMLLMNF